MKRLQLNVKKREITGKKVNNLRKEGIVPANIFGKKTKSQSIQVVFSDFKPVYKQAGETAIVDLVIGKAKTPHHSLIRHIQFDPVTDKILHVDFMEVDLKEKIETEVPIKIEGESQAVSDKLALLQQDLTTILIEATADNIPEEIVVNISDLKTVGETILTKNLKIPSGVTLKNDPEQSVVRLAELVKKEKEPEPESEEKEQPAEESEPTEGDEGEKKTKEETKDEKTD
jgi:large subunit ribosomal protein L25